MTILPRLAWRNLWRHRRRTWLTSSAIAFSAMLLVFMISIQLGAYDMFIDVSLRVFTGQMQVQREGYRAKPQMRSTVPDAAAQAARLRQNLKLETIATRAQGFALASSNARSYGVPVIGVEPIFEARVSTLPHLVKEGRYLSSVYAQELVLGAALARNLKVKVGDEITLLGSGKDGSVAATILPVVGVFESGNPELDRHLVQVPLETFQDIFSMGKDAHVIVVSGNNHETIPQTKVAVAAQLAGDTRLVVLDWEELIPGLKQLIQTDMIQNWITYIALILIVTLSIMNTFLMSVLERTREFGIMLALGMNTRQIGAVVLMESLFLTLLGLAIGIAIGGSIAVWLHFEGFSFPGMKEIYAQYGLPGQIHPKISMASFLLGPSVILVFTMLAAIYPALRLRKLQPVEAIHAL